jgi:glycosyltransferase involved in cell wall biosynthesis
VTALAALSERTVLLDCRWLDVGGIGRMTDLLLRGLADLAPPGRWLCWGHADRVAPRLWGSTQAMDASTPPNALWGQADWRRVPPHDVAIHLGPMRPLRFGPSVTFVYDTIPLRHDAGALVAAARRAYLTASAALSTRVVTLSSFARSCLERDLRVPRQKVDVLRPPVDEQFAARVAELRGTLPRRDAVLYVGRFAAHKNLSRLLVAFSATRFAREGGELVLVGGAEREVQALTQFAHTLDGKRITVLGVEPRPKIDELYATCRLLALPSLEEGFGLSAWEAVVSGLPVCMSEEAGRAGLGDWSVATFPASSVPAMTRALDRALAAPSVMRRPTGRSTRAFAARVAAAAAAALARRS